MADSAEYTSEQMKHDMSVLKLENAIQTIAVVLAFFWGVTTIRDILKNQ